MRAPASRRKPAKTQAASFPAPVGGWIANRNLAIGRDPKAPPGAAVLDDWFPTSTGILMRRGSERRYSIGSAPVKSMFRYVSGNQQKLFASISGPVIDITTGTSSVARSGGADGDWQVQQFSTTGGTFLIGVNGASTGWIYDGATFANLSITFPDSTTSADLGYVWAHANRLWFIRKDTTDVYYLAVDSIGGAATKLPLGGEFTMGGALLFGATWSLASGGSGGLSDQCVFVSTEGEVVAFQGNNPGSAATWGRVGLYRIGEPLGRKGHIRAGGDILIATSVGLVSLAKASQTEFAALGAGASSHPIEEAWAEAIGSRGMVDWRCHIWAEGKMVIVIPPRGMDDDPVAFIANANTGAWCRFRNWDVSAMEIFDGRMHFGDRLGAVWLGNVTGSDNGAPFTATFIPLFEDLGQPASRKVARHARVVKRSAYPSVERILGRFDFDMSEPAAPSPSPSIDVESVWGTGEWGTSVWGESSSTVITNRWTSIGGSGQDVSVCLQVTSGDAVPLDVEIIRIDAAFEYCGVIS